MRWTVIIPAKALPEAKSRLAPASTSADAHHRLVTAIRADTIAAAGAAETVARVVLVVDRPEEAGPGQPAGVEILVQRAAGLNAALREAARHAATRWPADGVAALVGDLPALRPHELAAALGLAADVPAAFVADAAGTGTTLLTAAPGVPLGPAFGPGSARRHGARATPLAAGPGLRQDVDTAPDLDEAALLGLGAATAAELAGDGLTARSP